MAACDFDKLLTRNVPHILEKIFFSIDYASFKKCLEVSKSWNDILKTESFLKRGTTLFWKEIHHELKLAAYEGNVDTITYLLSSFEANVNYQSYSNGPLHQAAFQGHKDVVFLLLERGADLNMANQFGSTALHRAAYKGHKDVVLLLLDRGADPNMANEEGSTALHQAARGCLEGHTDVARLFLDRGTDPNMAAHDGVTALHLAAYKCNKEMVLLLLQKGADPNIATNQGTTPLALVQGALPAQTGEKTRALADIANILKEYGATV